MAEAKENPKAQESAAKIQAIGPSNESSNSQILRYQPMNKRKNKIDIQKDQILIVGEDITNEDAERLLSLKVWNFERVND